MQLPGLEKPADVIASPMKFSKTKVDYRLPPPALGQHSESILGSVGYTSEEIAKMLEEGII